jgi:hypothetical protein
MLDNVKLYYFGPISFEPWAAGARPQTGKIEHYLISEALFPNVAR